MMEESDTSSGAHLQVDPSRRNELYRTLKETPRVAAVNIKQAALKSFEDTVAENLLRMRLTNICFATIIAFGVVYNSARISLSERSRELSTLRVIGFTRREISGILLGELALLTLAAMLPGMLLGYGFAAYMTLGLQTEIYRIPLVVEQSTFAFAAAVVMIAAVVSGLIVRRRIDRLDLVAALKSRD
jgi:putative ABC transport system permease protein